LHRYKIEQQLGRKLSRKEIVHHKDKNPKNNNLNNLLLTNLKEHNSIYHKKEVDYVELICLICKRKFKRRKKKYDWDIANGINSFYCSKSCAGKVNAQYLPKENEDYTKKIKEGLNKGWSGYKISKEYKINNTTVYNHLKKLNYIKIDKSRYKKGKYRCGKCKKYLLKSEFHKTASNKYGIDRRCKFCKKVCNHL
jgi:hypothetical protein